MIRLASDYLRTARALALSPEEVQALQWKRFAAIIAHAYENVPFYREKFDAAGIRPADIRSREDLVRIPITTKEELRSAGARAFARGYSEKNCFPSKTSGSTGTPFTSYLDARSWSLLKYAAKWRARRRCGVAWGSRIVNIEVCTPREAARMSRGLLRSLMRMKYLSLFDDFGTHARLFQAFRPEYAYGLPSYFLELGEYLDRHRIAASSLKGIFVSGELMSGPTKKKIADRFGVPVFDIYGNTELKEIAWECGRGDGYHLNEDLHLVEFIEDGIPGDRGELVATSLTSRGMPFIRYSVGDIGARAGSGGACACGAPFSMMLPVLGRESDHIIAPDGTRISPYLLTDAIERIEAVLQYQILQSGPRRIDVLARTAPDSFPHAQDEIAARLSETLGGDFEIRVEHRSLIPRDANGKYRIVRNEAARSPEASARTP